MQVSANELARGPFPTTDGWGWLYRSYEWASRHARFLRPLLSAYFRPTSLERWRDGRIYRLAGVHWFGAVIPTGGIFIRRITGARMAPYTLSGSSLRSAREFLYRTCVFEALHLPFFLVLAALAATRLAQGRSDLALQDMVINLIVNGYPMLHHRRTRTRIVELLARHHLTT